MSITVICRHLVGLLRRDTARWCWHSYHKHCNNRRSRRGLYSHSSCLVRVIYLTKKRNLQFFSFERTYVVAPIQEVNNWYRMASLFGRMFTYQVWACVVTVTILFITVRVVSIYRLHSIEFIDAFMHNVISPWKFKIGKRFTTLRILALAWGRQDVTYKFN